MTKSKFKLGSKRALAVGVLKKGWIELLDLSILCGTSRPDMILSAVRKSYKVKTKTIHGRKHHRI